MDFVMDAHTKTARVDGRNIGLTRQEFLLLFHLYRHPLRVFTRDQLLNTVWEDSSSLDGRTVDVHVANIRVKMEESAQSVETVRNQGYRFSPVA